VEVTDVTGDDPIQAAADPATEAVEVGYRALLAAAADWQPGDELGQPWGRYMASIVIAAAFPLIRRDTLREAADALTAFDGVIAIARAIDPALVSLEVVAHNPVQGEAMHKVIGYHAAQESARLVRELGEQQ
jgi:hypothetical protein